MSELADRLHLSPSGITRRIDGLVKSGLVERRPCPSDRRGSNAVLTPLGLKTLRTAAPTHVRGVREHFVDRLDERALAAARGRRCRRSTSTTGAPPAAATPPTTRR